MNKVKIILISGKQGSGKTTLSKALVDKLQLQKSTRAIVMKFAGPLYRMHKFCIGYLKQHGIDRGEKDGVLLQLLGTEWGRKRVDENIWVKILQSEIKIESERLELSFDNVFIIVDDCRFKNELEGFPNALKIRLECDRETRKARCDSWRDNEMHPSEIDLDDHVLIPGKFDLIFNTAIMPVGEIIEIIEGKLHE